VDGDRIPSSSLGFAALEQRQHPRAGLARQRIPIQLVGVPAKHRQHLLVRVRAHQREPDVRHVLLHERVHLDGIEPVGLRQRLPLHPTNILLKQLDQLRHRSTAQIDPVGVPHCQR